jgi:predicted Abi (CAAX) family protease
MSWQELGLDLRDAPRGVVVGIAAATALGAGTAGGLLIPHARRFYLDDRIVSAGLGQMLREVFVRVPLGTAVPEELVFRGALLGLVARRRTRVSATITTAVLFGLWHILPTLDRIESNPGTRHTKGDHLRTAAVVAMACTATAAAGLGFSWLRFRSGSVLAPVLAHIAPNAVGFLGGWAVSRLTSSSPPAPRTPTDL